MRCPHCAVAINLQTESREYYELEGEFGEIGAVIEVGFCPECREPIVEMRYGTICDYDSRTGMMFSTQHSIQLFPKFNSMRKLNQIIPEQYSNNFKEAEQVLQISPKASATISRYLLQMVLHEELGIKKRNLDDELKALENKSDIPTTLITMLQVMRKVANFGAHPKKSTNSAEIVDVEPHEAEVMLDLLEELFDYVFVKPAKNQEFIEAAKEKYGIEI